MLSNIRRHSVWLFTIVILTGLLVGCSGGVSVANKPVDVNISLTEFKFDSSLTTFKVGVPYHFIVANEGSVPHELEIMPPTKGQVSQGQIDQLSLVVVPLKDLSTGATKTIDYTFSKAYAPGALEFACHAPGHYEAGMRLPITVEQ